MTEEFAIRARGLTKNFGNLCAVNHLDLDVPRAMIYGFLGPNGSGKTTAIRMLCGLLTPTSGEAVVLDFEVPGDAIRLKPKIGYMTQKFSLYGDLSVRENLAFIADIYSYPRAARNARITELLQEYEFEDRAGQLAGTMSGGQKQRLALACAVLHKPELLLLDEPTSAVDPRNRRDFWARLFRLASNGTTVLVSTHYMDEAERCHRLAILDHGIKVADGTPQDLQSNTGMTIIEVLADDPYAAQAVIQEMPIVASVTPCLIVRSSLGSSGVSSRSKFGRSAVVAAKYRAGSCQVSPSARPGRLKPSREPTNHTPALALTVMPPRSVVSSGAAPGTTRIDKLPRSSTVTPPAPATISNPGFDTTNAPSPRRGANGSNAISDSPLSFHCRSLSTEPRTMTSNAVSPNEMISANIPSSANTLFIACASAAFTGS